MDLRINNSRFNQSFGVKLSSDTSYRIYHSMLDITGARFVTRLKNLRYWGSNDSVISYRLTGVNRDRFVLTNPTVSDKEIPLTNTTESRGLINTFFEEIDEGKILEAEKALTY